MSIWTQDRFRGQRRHALGLILTTATLASRAYFPSLRDRAQLRGLRPFWQVFGGTDSNGNAGSVAIPGNQWIELRQVCQSDFIAHTLLVSSSVGDTQTNPGVRVGIRDISPRAGKKPKDFCKGFPNDINFGGSAQHPFFLRYPYRFHAGHTILVRIQNLQSVNNNVQVVIVGVVDE